MSVDAIEFADLLVVIDMAAPQGRNSRKPARSTESPAATFVHYKAATSTSVNARGAVQRHYGHR
jgi:hypothetical protein